MRTWSLSGVFIGYMGYYLVRNNITLSTPFIQNQLNLSKSDIGTITGSMLIAYGISKGAMSVISDKAGPKKYMALGLILCALVNVLLGFSNSFYAYVGFVIALGVFQGMGVGPSFITLANWYPKKERGIYTAIWNISHNLGGGIIAPIVSLSGFALAAFLGVSLADFMKHISISIIFMFLLFVLCLLAFMCFMQSKEVLKMKVWLILLKSMKCEGLKQKKSKL
ncbi:MFS transporter [Campylobacter coli]